jgi:hypothetical protein
MDAIISEMIDLVIQSKDKARKQTEKQKNKNKCFRMSIRYSEGFNTISVGAFVRGMPDMKLEKQVKNRITTFSEEQLGQLQEAFAAELNGNPDFWDDEVALCLEIGVKIDSNFVCPFPEQYRTHAAEPAIWKKKMVSGNAVYLLKQTEVQAIEVTEVTREEPIFDNEFVRCTINSSESQVIFTVKNECQSAYEGMLEFLIAQLENDFSRKYSIELEGTTKNYLPEVAETDTNCFFRNCSEYIGLFPLMRKYFQIALKEYSNYTDTGDGELLMPCGGYAAFALSLASPENFDTLRKFMKHHDSEHIIAPRYLVYRLFNQYGWSKETVTLFCDCIYYGNDVLAEAKDLSVEVLKGILAYVQDQSLKNYQVEMLVNGIWEDFEKTKDEATDESVALFQQLSEMME